MLMAGALPAEPEGLLALGALPGQKDTTWTKLFVGGLPYHTTDKSLREHFAVYGDIEEAVVITDRQTSKSRGYGFVIMGDRAAAERACKDPNPIIDGRKANVNLAILGAKPRGNLAPGFGLAAAAAAGVRAGYQTVLPSPYGLSPGYMYSTPQYMNAMSGVGASVGTGAGGLVQLPQLQHAAAVAAANHLYEYQAAAAQGAAAYQQQYAAAGFDPYATAAAAAAAASGAGYSNFEIVCVYVDFFTMEEFVEVNQISDFISYLRSIEWRDPWLMALISFHIIITFTCFSTRNYGNFQVILFIILLLLVYFSENINEVAARNWALFSRQQYFDSKGLFISVVFSIPILLNCMIMVGSWLYQSTQIMTNLKKAQLRQRLKEMNMNRELQQHLKAE